MKNTKNTRYIVTGAVIAAMYVVLTFISNALGMSYGPIQFRISEALTILPVFTPAAIPGLVVGCLISNIFSFNPIDMVFGTFASLIASLLTRKFRGIKFWGVPIVSLLPPILANAFIVGAEIAIFYLEGTAFWNGFLLSAVEVGLSQTAVCFLLGIPLYLTLQNKRNLF